MNIFITGASGFVGRAFTEALLKRLLPGDRVFALSRSPAQYGDSRIIPLKGSIERIADFGKEALSSEYFFHIAADPRLHQKDGRETSGSGHAAEIAGLLKQSGSLKKVVFISSIAAASRSNGDNCARPLSTGGASSPDGGYGRSKLAAESVFIKSGLPYVILRPAFVYGKNMRAGSHVNKFVSMVLGKSPFIRLDYPGKFSLIHADDLASALVNCVYGAAPANRIYYAVAETSTAGEIFGLIHEKLYGRPLARLPGGFIRALAGIFRAALPLNARIFFLDYFWAEDERFAAELLNNTPVRRIRDHIEDVISTNKDSSRKDS